MRTDKKYEERIRMSEWQADVAEHYTPQNQLKRVDETVNFIRDHCYKNKNNNVATFKGVWGYLDVDAEYLNVFKKSLKSSMQDLHKLKIKYDTKRNDIVVHWE